MESSYAFISVWIAWYWLWLEIAILAIHRLRQATACKGLVVALEPTIGNHDQEFLDNWYSKQKQFSLSLMKDIVQFCEKTINKSAQDIKKTESSLKRNASQSQYHAIQTEINANEDSMRKVLRQ